MRAAGGSGPGEGQWWGLRAMAVGHGTAGDGRESEARQAAMTSGPDDCHVTMQAAMAVRGLVLRWP